MAEEAEGVEDEDGRERCEEGRRRKNIDSMRGEQSSSVPMVRGGESMGANCGFSWRG
jgi:hypothetical protein